MYNTNEEYVYFKIGLNEEVNRNGASYKELTNQIKKHLIYNPIYVTSTPHGKYPNENFGKVDINDIMLIAESFKDGEVGVSRKHNKCNFDLVELSKNDNVRLSPLYLFDKSTNNIKIISFNLVCI